MIFKVRRLQWAIAFWTGLALFQSNAADQAQLQRGKLLYLQNCVICHQSSGQGAPGVFPPLQQSDYFAKDITKAILPLVQGLSGKIKVNGRAYDGTMPPVNLDDSGVADVLTYVRSNFGNSGEPVTPEQVKATRAQSRFPTFSALQQANTYAPLPQTGAGLALREVARLSEHGHRLLADKSGAIFVLGPRAEIWQVNLQGGQLTQILRTDSYIQRALGDITTTGFTFDQEGRLYIVADQRNESGSLVTNIVTIFRSAGIKGGIVSKPEVWLRTNYPWGIGPFNHGVGHIAQGPDGFLYVGSGSRTDGNEAGQDPKYFTGGEVPLTACIWRLDPKSEHPLIEIYAKGLRNCYGFCWNDKGEMFATDNGPDADAPEELNWIRPGKHYGFPYKFSNWKDKPYGYTPEPRAGLEFSLPVANFGPAASGNSDQPYFTFGPHSSPAGIVFLDKNFPEGFRGTFLVTRFGNLIKNPKDAGFDLLQVRMRPGNESAEVTTFLAPLARPLDVVTVNGKIYILEYSRQTENRSDIGMLPGRVLELSFQK
ncbi:MAG TPA: PQQ-dependent sugar dehydrogenase [Verrucomicrobiae bacterium]|jgi:glucose/arabinose dehydrogenase/mono/diheme cytochrome c family protein